MAGLATATSASFASLLGVTKMRERRRGACKIP
jgi:hypothetical protein